MRRVWWAVILLGAAAGSMVAAACTDSTPPLGNGNTVTTAPSATMQPEGPGGDAGPYYDGYAYDSPYAAAPDGYSPLALCAMCSCPSGDYCFGGGTSYVAFSGNCNAEASADAFALGCQAIPAVCLTAPDGSRCDCLLKSLSFLPCYPDCIENTLTLYCPHP
jgi:hypothetical protein